MQYVRQGSRNKMELLSPVSDFPSDHPLCGYDWMQNEMKAGHDGRLFRVVTPLWRGLLQSETGLENLLRKLPPEFAGKVRLLSSQGNAALERDEWMRAEVRFKECYTVLEEIKQGSDQIGEGVCNFLLAWAGLPLAQLYQLLGSFGADLLATLQLSVSGTCKHMLEEALSWRRRVLEHVLSLGKSKPHLILRGVCRFHVCTAEYELGDLMSDSKTKEKAVDRMKEMLLPLGISKSDEVEAFLSFYLWSDHYFFLGNVEVSRRWIQKANRLWREHNRNWYSLQIEVELSMKLEKLGEAEEVLKDSMPYFSGRRQQQIREWLQQCYTQMSSRDSDQAEFYSALALSYSTDPQSPPYDTRLNTAGASVKADGSRCYGFLSFPHAINDPSPVPVGSWLGLVPGTLDRGSPQLSKMPFPILKGILQHWDLGKNADMCLDWERAVCNLQICREFLKLTKKHILDTDTYDWLLTLLDLKLARVYQYRLKKPEKAVELWEEMRDSAMHLLPKYLTMGYLLNLVVAEYECWSASKSGKHVEIDPGNAQSSSPGTDQKAAERQYCFWLYFHNYAHENFEASWKWLQNAKSLYDDRRPTQGCSVVPLEYFSCEYTFLRCEADICMKLQDFEKAIGILTEMLTRQDLEGNPALKREANEWLRECLQKCGCEDELDLEDIAADAPSPTGCYYVKNPAVNQLVQSVTGLEHHLHKLPVPFHLAFESHGKFGRTSLSLGDWEAAATHYEWCRELLELLKFLKWSSFKVNFPEETSFNWLVVWADVSLVEIYGFAGLMQPRRALDLLREMITVLPENSDGDAEDHTLACLLDLVFKCLYQCAKSDSKLKDEVIKRYCEVFRINDTRACEEKILLELYLRSFACCKFEESWKYIHELNERLPTLPDDNKYDNYLCKEVVCLTHLGRFDEAKKLIKEYWRASGKAEVELPPTVRILMIQFGLGSSINEGPQMTWETRMSRTLSGELIRLWRDRFKKERVKSLTASSDEYNILMSQLAFCELAKLRQKSCVYDPTISAEKNFEEAVKRLEDCLKVSDGDRWGPSHSGSGRRTYFAIPTKSNDYVMLGTLHMMWFFSVLPSLKIETIEDVKKNKYFSAAVKYYTTCIELESRDTFYLDKVEAAYALVQLFGEVDEYYGVYLKNLYHKFGPHRAEQQRQKQSTPCSSSGSFATDANNELLREGLRHVAEKIREYLIFQNPMDTYGKVASLRLTSSLRTMVSQRNAEGLIQALDTFSDIYPYLQSHYYRKATFALILRGCLYYLQKDGRPYSESYSNRKDAPFEAEGIISNTKEIRISRKRFSSSVIIDYLSIKSTCRDIENVPNSPHQEAIHCGKEADDSCKEAAISGKRGGKEVVYSGEEAVDNRRDVSASQSSSKVEMLLPLVQDEGSLKFQDVKDDYIEDLKWKAFLYAERERTRVMLYAVGSDRLDYSASRKLWGFDVDDAEAVDSIRRDCSTFLQDGAVFVEYSRLPDKKTYLIYLVDQQGKLSLTHTTMQFEGGANIEELLEDLYKSLEPQRKIDPVKLVKRIDRKLENLYDVLIAPIAVDLAKLDIEQKLILAPTELLWQVPFVALRNKEKYLIESHTIAFTPSLRTLKVCSDRLEDLQSSFSNIGLGSIVALGNPAYQFCDVCERLPLLEQTKEEVEHIARFLWNDGTAVVKKLLWEHATAEELLDWASRPSHERFRQTLVHIGSHADVSDGKPVLLLACPHARSPLGAPIQVDLRPVGNVDQPARMNEIQSSHVRRGKIDPEVTTGEDDNNHEEEGNDNDVPYDRKRLPPNLFSKQPLELKGRLKGILVSGEGHSTDYRSAGDSSTRSFAGSHDLKAEDICRSEWRAELVVLSACRTSRGKLTAVEGVLSLARAYIISGVPCAVASLWKVDDKDTCTLMTMFYDELLGKGTDVASALCSAMRKGLGPEQNFAVKSWAPFLVYGVPALRIPALRRAI